MPCVNFSGDSDNLIFNLFQMKNKLIKTIVILFLQLFAKYDWQWTTSAYSVLSVFGRLDNLPEQNYIKKNTGKKNQCYFKASWFWTSTGLPSSNSGLEAVQVIVFFSNIMCASVHFSTPVNLIVIYIPVYSCFTIPLNLKLFKQLNSATWFLSRSKNIKTVIASHCQHIKDRDQLLWLWRCLWLMITLKIY